MTDGTKQVSAEAYEQACSTAMEWYRQNMDLIAQRDVIWAENRRWREIMRRAVDIAWGRALEDNSVPSSQIVDEIIMTARGFALPPKSGEPR